MASKHMKRCSVSLIIREMQIKATVKIYLTPIKLATIKKKKKKENWSSRGGLTVMNPTSIHEEGGSIPGLTQWIKDLALLWAAV